ncbi:MAG: M14 family metallopeptidase [Deltaproteobacteria bacterium]|nr:M14 family metallopeptidase [Deltaproteobacteria bacterium]
MKKISWPKDSDIFTIGHRSIRRGETAQVHLKVSETYSSRGITIPISVVRGKKPGPILFVTAVVHGDEINGVEIIHNLIYRSSNKNQSGTLVCVPVVNILGFYSQTRYLPDGRDLNRFFPGDPNGTLTERYAHTFFNEVIVKCHFGIDLHTAGHGRVNIPHVRGDLPHAKVRFLAESFECPIILDRKGIEGSLRRTATEKGIPTIIYEAGESGRFQYKATQEGVRGVIAVMEHLKMRTAKKHPRAKKPLFVKETEWIRADRGGVIDLKIRPGETVAKGQLLGINVNPFGKEVHHISSPYKGLVISTITSPVVQPGNPICHIVRL